MGIIRLIPSVHYLTKLTLKKIFEGLTHLEEKTLEEGINEQVRKKNLTLTEKQTLDYIIQALIKNEKDEFKQQKEKLKELNIDWRVVYRAELTNERIVAG